MRKSYIWKVLLLGIVLQATLALGSETYNQDPQIMHNPPLRISSVKNFNLTASIKNIGYGIPVVNYRFEGEGKYRKRALHKIAPDRYGYKVYAAAMSGKEIDYYFEVINGTRVTASVGSSDYPIKASIVAPQYNMVVLYLAILSTIIWSFVKLGTMYYKKILVPNKKVKQGNIKPTVVRTSIYDKLSAKAR